MSTASRLPAFRPGWTMTTCVALFLPLLVLLGFWQLDRAAQKRGLEASYLARLGTLPVAPPASVEPATDFLRVRLTGRYEADHDYLVDNRLEHGQPGYWVVSRFAADDGRRYLVNRGWLAAPPSRARLPDAPAVPGSVSVVGVLWPDTGLPPLLADDPWSSEWPRRVQRLDVARMAGQGQGVVPVEVRLEVGQPGTLVAAPLDVDFHPERHTGYAVQWFAMAAVLSAGFVIFGRRRARETGATQEEIS